VQPESVQEDGSAPDVIRHLVLLGDALQNIDMGMDPAEAVLVPRPRNPWKLTVLEAPHVLERGWSRAIPLDATTSGSASTAAGRSRRADCFRDARSR